MPQAPCKREVTLGFDIGSDSIESAGAIRVIVILVDGKDIRGRIDHGNICRPSFPDQPMVPINAANHERRQVPIHATREDKIVDGPWELQPACAQSFLAQMHSPIRMKLNWPLHWRIPSLAYYQEPLGPSRGSGYRRQKTAQKHNVAIRITQEIVAGDLLRARKHIVEPNSASFTQEDIRNVMDAQFSGNFARARHISKQNDFALRVEKGPTSERVALPGAILPQKWLGSGKDCEHLFHREAASSSFEQPLRHTRPWNGKRQVQIISTAARRLPGHRCVR
jgi:hypothetical protein